MISVRVDNGYHGPTIIQIAELLDLSDDDIEVNWLNTKPELQIINRYRDRTIMLVVPDLVAMERAASTLGISYALPQDLIERGFSSLNTPDGLWREFGQQVGPGVSRSVLEVIAARNICKGKDVRILRKVLVDCLFENVSPADIDVLVGLRSTGIVI